MYIVSVANKTLEYVHVFTGNHIIYMFYTTM